MLAVLLTIHLIACLALVISVLLQRSECGALGMGGGGTGGIISGRGAAGALVKVTMGLAAVFFTTSILMTRLNAEDAAAPTELERATQQQGGDPFGTGATPTIPTPDATVPGTPPATTPAPAPTTPDPLAPASPPATTTTPATPPATTTPAQPAPAPADPLAPATPGDETPNQ
jgi:preprotein translocase subunit SecG